MSDRAGVAVKDRVDRVLSTKTVSTTEGRNPVDGDELPPLSLSARRGDERTAVEFHPRCRRV